VTDRPWLRFIKDFEERSPPIYRHVLKYRQPTTTVNRSITSEQRKLKSPERTCTEPFLDLSLAKTRARRKACAQYRMTLSDSFFIWLIRPWGVWGLLVQ
jgi:hypothetical protein